MKSLRRLFVLQTLLCLCLLVSGQSAWAQALTERQIASVNATIEAQMAEQGIVGLAVGIIQKRQIVYLNGYGWADRENRVPVGPETMFRWASISKTLTAVSALQLEQAKKLDLDADVRSYVPEFPAKGTPITARQILCHQSGISHYSNGTIVATPKTYEAEHPFEDVTVAIDTFKDSPLLFTPGEKFSYSSYAYILLSAVVQRNGGEKFAAQVEKRIARPLGLKTLQPDYQWLDIPNRAAGYRKGKLSTDTDVSWKLGGGGFISTIGDITLFAQGLLNYKVLSQPASTAAWQAQPTASGESTEFGLGFHASDNKGTLRVHHGGSQEKSSCRMVFYPKTGLGVVVMSNSENIEPGQISTAIFAAMRE